MPPIHPPLRPGTPPQTWTTRARCGWNGQKTSVAEAAFSRLTEVRAKSTPSSTPEGAESLVGSVNPSAKQGRAVGSAHTTHDVVCAEGLDEASAALITDLQLRSDAEQAYIRDVEAVSSSDDVLTHGEGPGIAADEWLPGVLTADECVSMLQRRAEGKDAADPREALFVDRLSRTVVKLFCSQAVRHLTGTKTSEGPPRHKPILRSMTGSVVLEPVVFPDRPVLHRQVIGSRSRTCRYCAFQRAIGERTAKPRIVKRMCFTCGVHICRMHWRQIHDDQRSPH